MSYSSSRFFDRDENVVFCIFIVVKVVVLRVFLLVVFMVFLLVVFICFFLIVFIFFLLVVFLDFLRVKLMVFLVVVMVSGQSPPEIELVAHCDEAELPKVKVSELWQHVVGNVLLIKGVHQQLQALVVEDNEEWISWDAVHSAEQDTAGPKNC